MQTQKYLDLEWLALYLPTLPRCFYGYYCLLPSPSPSMIILKICLLCELTIKPSTFTDKTWNRVSGLQRIPLCSAEHNDWNTVFMCECASKRSCKSDQWKTLQIMVAPLQMRLLQLLFIIKKNSCVPLCKESYHILPWEYLLLQGCAS